MPYNQRHQTRPQRLHSRDGTWFLDIECLVPLNRVVFRPHTQTIEGRQRILEQLVHLPSGRRLRESAHRVMDAADSGNASKSGFVPSGNDWAPFFGPVDDELPALPPAGGHQEDEGEFQAEPIIFTAPDSDISMQTLSKAVDRLQQIVVRLTTRLTQLETSPPPYAAKIRALEEEERRLRIRIQHLEQLNPSAGTAGSAAPAGDAGAIAETGPSPAATDSPQVGTEVTSPPAPAPEMSAPSSAPQAAQPGLEASNAAAPSATAPTDAASTTAPTDADATTTDAATPAEASPGPQPDHDPIAADAPGASTDASPSVGGALDPSNDPQEEAAATPASPAEPSPAVEATPEAPDASGDSPAAEAGPEAESPSEPEPAQAAASAEPTPEEPPPAGTMVELPSSEVLSETLKTLVGDEFSLADDPSPLTVDEDLYVCDLVDDAGNKIGAFMANRTAVTFIGGSLLMLPPDQLKELIEANEESPDAVDAMSEVFNTLSGKLNDIAANAHVRSKPLRPFAEAEDAWVSESALRLDMSATGGGKVAVLAIS